MLVIINKNCNYVCGSTKCLFLSVRVGVLVFLLSGTVI